MHDEKFEYIGTSVFYLQIRLLKFDLCGAVVTIAYDSNRIITIVMLKYK